jgi:hypothetical protein
LKQRTPVAARDPPSIDQPATDLVLGRRPDEQIQVAPLWGKRSDDQDALGN